MILIGLGANLPGALGEPRTTLEAALDVLGREEGVAVEACSPWYRSAPVPVTDQPWYVNGVAAISTRRSAERLLALLHRVEMRFGRRRRWRNEPRVIDLDLLDYDGVVSAPSVSPILPHPRISARAFVLLPLRDVAPLWRHPSSRKPIDQLIAELPSTQVIERIDAAWRAGDRRPRDDFGRGRLGRTANR